MRRIFIISKYIFSENHQVLLEAVKKLYNKGIFTIDMLTNVFKDCNITCLFELYPFSFNCSSLFIQLLWGNRELSTTLYISCLVVLFIKGRSSTVEVLILVLCLIQVLLRVVLPKSSRRVALGRTIYPICLVWVDFMRKKL